MFPFLQLQIATNILHADNSDDNVEYVIQKNKNQIDPSVFLFDNYTAILPTELRNNEEHTHLKEIPINNNDSEMQIENIPNDLNTIRIFTDSKKLSPLLPGQLGIIQEGHNNKRAYFMQPGIKTH